MEEEEEGDIGGEMERKEGFGRECRSRRKRRRTQVGGGDGGRGMRHLRRRKTPEMNG